MKRLFSTDNRTAKIICNSLLGLVAMWMLASILGLNISCGAATKFALEHRCSGQVSDNSCIYCYQTRINHIIQITRWSVVATFDSLFEIAIFLLSIILVVPLQMTTEIKLSVVFAFSFRLVYVSLALLYSNLCLVQETYQTSNAPVSQSSQSSTSTTSLNGPRPQTQASQPSTPSSGNKSNSATPSWPPQSPLCAPSSAATKRLWAGSLPTTSATTRPPRAPQPPPTTSPP